MSVDRLAVLAHELRSPVAALATLAEAALDGAASTGEGRRRLVSLAAAAVRDVERLLVDPEPDSVRPEEIELAPLLEAFAAPFVHVRSDRGLVLRADPVRLRQVLANLVANGLRHGTVVRIDAVPTEDGVAVTVADDGPGVDPDVDVFAAGASGAGSTGYGLWVARCVAEAHGGTLTLTPAPGGGAAFTLALPRGGGVP